MAENQNMVYKGDSAAQSNLAFSLLERRRSRRERSRRWSYDGGLSLQKATNSLLRVAQPIDIGKVKVVNEIMFKLRNGGDLLRTKETYPRHLI